MNISYLGCRDSQIATICSFHLFENARFIEVEQPLTAIMEVLDLLIVGPQAHDLLPLLESLSDWEIPPVALCVMEASSSEKKIECFEHHPRVGRSFIFCKDTEQELMSGLEDIYTFYYKRHNSVNLDKPGPKYAINNVSPRWLFHSLMHHLDEYIYFKDKDSRFLAVSSYLVQRTNKIDPQEVLGLTDFDLYDSQHAMKSYEDESRISSGIISEVYKEEQLVLADRPIWVSTRKVPLASQNGNPIGSFGISRDITTNRDLRLRLQASNNRIVEELQLARKLQDALLAINHEKINCPPGGLQFESVTRYIPSFHLSGDFYAILEVPGQGVGMLLTDVMGHGVRSAMVTAMIQVAVRQLRQLAVSPAGFMRYLNSILFQCVNQLGQTLFATAVFCYADLISGQMTYVQSGGRHGMISSGGECHQLGGAVGPALGLLPDVTFKEERIDLHAGDRFLLYTDGLIEATAMGEHDREFGDEGIRQSMINYADKRLDQMLVGLLADAITHQGRNKMADDICLLAFEFSAPKC